MAEREVSFLVVPGLPEVKVPIRHLPSRDIPPPQLLSDRDETREIIALMVFAFALGAFIALAAEHLWWLA